MKCHVLSCSGCGMSCSVMVRRASDPIAASSPRLLSVTPETSLGMRGRGAERRVPHLFRRPGADPVAIPGPAFTILPAAFYLVSFPSVPFFLPPASPCGGPCFARIACGRGRAFAPARFARLIARARRKAHPSCLLPRGRFSRRRETKQPPDAAPDRPHMGMSAPEVKLKRGIISDFANEPLGQRGRRRARRAVRPRSVSRSGPP